MLKDCLITLSPKQAASTEEHLSKVAKRLSISEKEIAKIVLRKRSIDARSKKVKFHLKYDVYYNEEIAPSEDFHFDYKQVQNSKRVLIIGTGPAGLFAALQLLELGLKPILLERGKDVITRRKDLGILLSDHIVNPDSNYCFGEGGAGTYSDGKLYTRSKKRGDLLKILQVLVYFGASRDILIDAHPHIGTNKLPKIIAKMREKILDCGGEIHFDTRVVDILQKGNKVSAVKSLNGNVYEGDAVILATGHSARDIYELFHEKNWEIKAKSFALGIRIEHPQPIIDAAQYHCTDRGPYLPAAAYSLVHQVKGLGVFSFCMCPGGHIVPAATAPGELVVNGMSTSTRSSRFANSGIVVAVDAEKLNAYKKYGELSALKFQADVEKKAWEYGGKSQVAPAQRMVDFVDGKLSNDLNVCSYVPGIKSAPMNEVLPNFVGDRLKEAFKIFGRKIKGYYTNEANIVGVESRTSAPISIPRDSISLEHPQLEGLYPCGEGAGYAGGIVSAAMDGERCAKAIFSKI